MDWRLTPLSRINPSNRERTMTQKSRKKRQALAKRIEIVEVKMNSANRGDELLPDQLDLVQQKVVAEVYAGTIHPRVAAGLAPLLSLQLRAIETTDMLRLELLERRLEAIEKQSAKAPGDARLADVATAAKR